MDWVTIIESLGIPIALIIWFIYRDNRREKADAIEKEALTSEIKEVRDYQRNKLESMVLDTNTVMMQFSESNKKLIESNEKLTDMQQELHTAIYSKVKCLHDDNGG